MFHGTLSTPVSVCQPKSHVSKTLESVGRVLRCSSATFARKYRKEGTIIPSINTEPMASSRSYKKKMSPCSI